MLVDVPYFFIPADALLVFYSSSYYSNTDALLVYMAASLQLCMAAG
jgi:hypothetical protein